VLAGAFVESKAKVVTFSDIAPDVMEEVIRFATMDYLLNPPLFDERGESDKGRVVFQFAVQPGTVLDVLLAANFLAMPPLVSLATKMLAYYIEDVPSLSGMPIELVELVFRSLPPSQLLIAESRPEIAEYTVNTAHLWHRHCLDRQWEPREKLMQLNWQMYAPLANQGDVKVRTSRFVSANSKDLILFAMQYAEDNESTWRTTWVENEFKRRASYYSMAMSKKYSDAAQQESALQSLLEICPYVRLVPRFESRPSG
jgi:hypothetical protein